MILSNNKINVAIIGVGNCASSLVQGVHYYAKAKKNEFVPLKKQEVQSETDCGKR